MLIQTAQKMIAQYIAIGIAKMIAGLGGPASGGLGAAGSSAGAAAFGGSAGSGALGFLSSTPKLFANGGIVNRPMMFKFANGGQMQNGVMGEAGPEAIMPLQRGPDGKLGVKASLNKAMSRYSKPPGAEAGAGGSGESEAMAREGASNGIVDVRYTVERINSVDYVTADQFQQGMARAAQQGAKQGEQNVMRKMQHSPSVRRRVGMS